MMPPDFPLRMPFLFQPPSPLLPTPKRGGEAHPSTYEAVPSNMGDLRFGSVQESPFSGGEVGARRFSRYGGGPLDKCCMVGRDK